VIAKWSRQATAETERTIYEEILPYLPLPTLHLYGFVKEPGGDGCWLLLECAGGEECSSLTAEHRALAAQWLGCLHTSAARTVGIREQLPDRGPCYYLDHLRSARNTIVRSLANPTLHTDELVDLKAIVSQCDDLEGQWSEVEDWCKDMPQTLVHGDFKGKNLRVSIGQAGMALMCFDWGEAGWGIAAVDLAQTTAPFKGFSASPDLTTYWSVVRQHWPSLDLEGVHRLATCGKMFRCLAALNWVAQNLAYPWTETPKCYRLRLYHAWLADIIQAREWRG
jgi:Phosphotransferase enzyme family